MLLRRVASPMVCSKRTMKEWFGSGSETIKIETPERFIPRVSTIIYLIVNYCDLLFRIHSMTKIVLKLN